MRKLSHWFLVLGLLTPFVTAGFVKRESDLYVAKFGVSPEGMGLFGIIALGAMVAFLFFVLSAVWAFRSYRALEVPRPSIRKIELVFILLLPLLVIAFVYFGMLGGPYAAPQVIRTN